jgi:hypothetical protein
MHQMHHPEHDLSAGLSLPGSEGKNCHCSVSRASPCRKNKHIMTEKKLLDKYFETF